MMVELEIKTTKAIHLLLEMNNYSEEDISKIKWVSVESLIKIDLYRALCSKHGKAFVWTKNPDEICYMIEDLLKENIKRRVE